MAFERKITTDGRKGGQCNIFLMNDNSCHDLGWRSSNVAPDTHLQISWNDKGRVNDTAQGKLYPVITLRHQPVEGNDHDSNV